MKNNDELSSVELQIILLAHCSITVSAHTISSQWNMLSIEHVLVQNVLQLTRNFSIPLAFPVLVTRSLLGYFCPALYCFRETTYNIMNHFPYLHTCSHFFSILLFVLPLRTELSTHFILIKVCCYNG